ncbi:histidine phosphatase family protein [Enterovibrio coralii]|uniref:Phosphoglycerate mutase n=1 Tax=Enterovibrio coralii TaxID=294935 RepID=A0A135I8U7_9GAMM|nr:histidine phosphatase family protein [Enterovibrio coralii]KXF81871.1 hypothetical protein ATN88_20490 [Enterovibrio coralii]
MSQIQYFAIVRHGDYYQIPDTPSANQPYALTPEGEAQAKQCAGYIAQFCQDKIIKVQFPLHSSASLRAWQTASLAGAELGFREKPVETYALGERSVGSMANLTIEEINRALSSDPRYPTPPDNWKSDSHYRLPYPGAESLLQAGQRVADYITDVLHTSDSELLPVFFGHGASFRHAMFHLGILSLDEAKARSMYHAKPIFFCRKAGGAWQHIAGEWKPRSKGQKEMD